MSFINECSQCHDELLIPDEACDRKVQCPTCGNIFKSEYRYNARQFYLENGFVRERLWIGDIASMFLNSLKDWDISKMDDWSVHVSSHDLRTVALVSSSKDLINRGIRHYKLGQCEHFNILKRNISNAMITERIIQGMAFEICRFIEPNWDQLTSQRWDE